MKVDRKDDSEVSDGEMWQSGRLGGGRRWRIE